MCKETREKIKSIRGLTQPVKKGLDMVMDEISKVNTQLNELKESTINQAKTTIEILELVNSINKKLTEGKIDEDAAQMRGLKAAAKQKRFWGVIAAIGLSFILSGVAIAYFVEHSRQVAEITHEIKAGV